MANGHANLTAERIQQDLARHEEEDAKCDISKRPSVVECPGDEQNLEDDVDE